MIITPDTRVEVQLSSGEKVFIKPITARNIQAIFDLASIKDKIVKGNVEKLLPEETEKILNIVKVSVDGWTLKEQFSEDKLLDKILFMDIWTILSEIVHLNFREPDGAKQAKDRNTSAKR